MTIETLCEELRNLRARHYSGQVIVHFESDGQLRLLTHEGMSEADAPAEREDD